MPLDLDSYIGKAIHREVLRDIATDELVDSGLCPVIADEIVRDCFPFDKSELEWGRKYVGDSILSVL